MQASATILLLFPGVHSGAAELHIGGATVSITPERPVALSGQMHTRIARTVESPVTATALALESRDGDQVLDQAIMVLCDSAAIREGIVQPNEYVAFLADRVADDVAKAWKTRKPGSVGWGLGYAIVALNRRSLYADGRAQMYGATNKPNFRGIEGYEDRGVEVLFF